MTAGLFASIAARCSRSAAGIPAAAPAVQHSTTGTSTPSSVAEPSFASRALRGRGASPTCAVPDSWSSGRSSAGAPVQRTAGPELAGPHRERPGPQPRRPLQRRGDGGGRVRRAAGQRHGAALRPPPAPRRMWRRSEGEGVRDAVSLPAMSRLPLLTSCSPRGAAAGGACAAAASSACILDLSRRVGCARRARGRCGAAPAARAGQVSV